MLWETFPVIRHHTICSPKSQGKILTLVPLPVVYYLLSSKVTLNNSLSEGFPGLSLAVFEGLPSDLQSEV